MRQFFIPRLPSLTLLFGLLAGGWLRAAETVPTSVITDPPRDAKFPAGMQVAAIPTGGVAINGVLYLAAGPGPHPTLVFFHGFPGNEQNLDLAQAVRRAGWNVLTLHYRGCWGSPGAFSFAHVQEDALAALAWVRSPQNPAHDRIDSSRLAIVGHSMGGFVAAMTGARDPALLGVGMIAAWNIGADAEGFAGSEAARKAGLADLAESMQSLAGCTPESLFEEMAAHGREWNFVEQGAGLAARPLLLVNCDDGLRAESDKLAAAARAAGAKQITERYFPTDHAFSDRRIALQGAVVQWLETLTSAPR